MPLTIIAIVLLVAAWAALLLPDLRGRGGRSSRRADSIATFNRQLSTIERARPGSRPSARVVAFPHRAGAPMQQMGRHGSSIAPRSSLQARKRRQNLLLGLFAFAIVTLAAAILVSPMLFVVHLLADLALGGYVWVLIDHRNRSFQQRAMRERRTNYEATPITRRRASGS